MGGAVGKAGSPQKAWIPETKIETKVVEAMRRRETHGSSIKSFNSIILKFPKIDESLRKCKATFEQFGKSPVSLYMFSSL
jgi:calcium-binding protein CML